jgi:hypothetical protein
MQHAYLKGKSTEIALHDLVYKIDGSLAQKEFALGVFLDVEGVFDNISFEVIDYASEGMDKCFWGHGNFAKILFYFKNIIKDNVNSPLWCES